MPVHLGFAVVNGWTGRTSIAEASSPSLSYAARSRKEAIGGSTGNHTAPIRTEVDRMAQQAAIAIGQAKTRGEHAEARQLRRAAAWLAQNNGRPRGSNRRSPHEIRQIIRTVFAAHPGKAFRTRDLCDILYPNLPTRAHIAKTNHEARKVVATDPDWACELSADQREVVFFNRADECSAAIAEEMLAPKPKRPRMRRPPRVRRLSLKVA